MYMNTAFLEDNKTFHRKVILKQWLVINFLLIWLMKVIYAFSIYNKKRNRFIRLTETQSFTTGSALHTQSQMRTPWIIKYRTRTGSEQFSEGTNFSKLSSGTSNQSYSSIYWWTKPTLIYFKGKNIICKIHSNSLFKV